MKTTAPSTHPREWWSLLAVLLIAAVWLYRTPYNASDLEVPPDSVEYSIAALQFLETGKYEIVVQGRSLPPRYPPSFSVLALLPAYALLGSNVGNAIIPVTLFAVAGIGFAWAIGRQIGGTASAIFASLGLLALPAYAMWGTKVMTDVPCTALMLGACLLYLRIRREPASMLLFVAAGVLVAVATLFRPVFAAMTLPFIFAAWMTHEHRVRSLAGFVSPLVAAAAASLAYNARTFGSPGRNGYHFWTAIPADYPALAFSLGNVRMNLGIIAAAGFPLLVAIATVAWLLARKWKPANYTAAYPALREVVIFGALTSAPISLFHLLYFFPGDRFHLPLLATAAIVAGSTMGLLLAARHTALLKLVLPALLLLALAWRVSVADPDPRRRIAADMLQQQTPPNAIIISGIEPGYLDRLVARNSARRILPFSRHVEYASKLLVRKRIENPQPPPIDWRDHRAPGLLRAGAEEAVPFVASERIPELVQAAQSGTPIFLETSAIGGRHDAAIVARLQERFTLVQRSTYLYELQLL